MTIRIDVGTTYYRDLNEQIRTGIKGGETDFALTHVYGQRYIGNALQAPVHIDITGTPGNDMAAFMDGCTIEVHGNAQDQVGNTMNAGQIVVHGRCGDAAGYAMRGGSIFVRDNCGWRNGIHMKQYEKHCPELVVGGNAGSFLGEYMAGGVILLLGKPGHYVGNGMHGGVIYLGHPLPEQNVNPQLAQSPLDEEDAERVNDLLTRYNSYFGLNVKLTDEFRALRPISSRPYEALYT